jgi:hypothetical protein
MSNQLARREITPELFHLITSMAPTIHASRLYLVSSPEQAAVIMLTGASYGFDPVASFRNIHLIDGKPSLAPAGALGLVQDSGLLESMDVKEANDAQGRPYACTVTMKRRDIAQPFSASFTMDDARAALLTQGSPAGQGKRGYGNWEKYPANMLRWRAIGFCCDVLFADVLSNMKRSDEFAASDEDGVINVTPEVSDG